MPKPSLPYLSHTLLGKTSSFDCLILKEPFLSDLCIEWRSPILVAAIKTYPTGKIYGKLGSQSVLKCYYGELEPMQFPQERTFNEESNMLIPSCILCNAEVERSSHLFFECHFARALWTNSGWGLRINSDLLNPGEDILKLILNPPNALVPANECWTISLNMALIIEEIWKARNLKLFQHDQPILSKAMMNVNAKFLELSKVYSPLIHTNTATTYPPT